MSDPNRPKILIHPGFHKTGTSSIQQMLWVNRVRLAPHLGVLLLRHLRPAAKICMAYARDQNPLRLTDMVEVMDEVLAQNDLSPSQIGGRDLVLSCEGLVGHLPGFPNVDTYAVAPITIAFLTGYFEDRFPFADVQVVLTTREAEGWLYSAWRHHLLAHRMRMDWPAFERRFRPAADLLAVIRDVNDAISPVPLFTLDLEAASAHALGPGGALLEMVRLPRATRAALQQVDPVSLGCDAKTAAALLALNLSGQPDDVVKARKAQVAAQAQAGTGRKRA